MYMKQISNSNYENDDQEYLSGFIEYLSEKQDDEHVVESNHNNISVNIDTIPPYKKNSVKYLTSVDLNSLYRVSHFNL